MEKTADRNGKEKGKSSDLSVMKCLCQKTILPANIVSHTKLCSHFKAIFGDLPEAIDNSLKAAKNIEDAKALWHFFAYAKNCCKEKFRFYSKVVHDPPILPPIPNSDTIPGNFPRSQKISTRR